MKDQILSSINPQLTAVKAFIEANSIKEWNQDMHAGFIIWTGIQLGLLIKGDLASQTFSKMLRKNGCAGNASQFRQALEKPVGKHELAGLLSPKAEVDPLADPLA